MLIWDGKKLLTEEEAKKAKSKEQAVKKPKAEADNQK